MLTTQQKEQRRARRLARKQKATQVNNGLQIGRLGIALSYLAAYGLHDWKVVIHQSRKRAGFCNYPKKIISFSSFYINNPEVTRERFINTVLHEVAHALVGVENKRHHSDKWRQIFLKMGGDGKVHCETFAKPRAMIQCSSCSISIARFKVPRVSGRHRSCGGTLYIKKVE